MLDSCKIHSIRFCGVFFHFRQNLIAYCSFKCPHCIFEIHHLWQSGFSRVYTNSCCSGSFEPEIIKIGESSHKMYSNNILNCQESSPILTACTKKKKAGNVLNAQRIYIYIYIYMFSKIDVCACDEHVWVRVWVYLSIYEFAYLNMCVYIYMCACECVCFHVYLDISGCPRVCGEAYISERKIFLCTIITLSEKGMIWLPLLIWLQNSDRHQNLTTAFWR